MGFQVKNTGDMASDVVIVCFAQQANATDKDALRSQLIGFARISNVAPGNEVRCVSPSEPMVLVFA